MSNKNLTAANEAAVQALQLDPTAKTRWQAVAATSTKRVADLYISTHWRVPLSTVRAARYYW
jgi:hypothetical protein